MSLRSTTYRLKKASNAKTSAKKEGLLTRHRAAVEKVVADAKTFSDDRRSKLDKIADETLRQSAAR